MSTPNCLVFERWGDWASAIRRQWIRSGRCDAVATGESASRVNSAKAAVGLPSPGRIVEIREWDGLRGALEKAPASLVCVATSTIGARLWLTRWPLIQLDFPMARGVALAASEDRSEEALWRDAGMVEVIRGRDDVGCVTILFARQFARYPAPASSWRTSVMRRLPWGLDD
ncbi:MAG: hypothetical protein ACKO38_14770, partial [Planctomycetota bacterium]